LIKAPRTKKNKARISPILVFFLAFPELGRVQRENNRGKHRIFLLPYRIQNPTL
jgi:hypothetical protein